MKFCIFTNQYYGNIMITQDDNNIALWYLSRYCFTAIQKVKIGLAILINVYSVLFDCPRNSKVYHYFKFSLCFVWLKRGECIIITAMSNDDSFKRILMCHQTTCALIKPPIISDLCMLCDLLLITGSKCWCLQPWMSVTLLEWVLNAFCPPNINIILMNGLFKT